MSHSWPHGSPGHPGGFGTNSLYGPGSAESHISGKRKSPCASQGIPQRESPSWQTAASSTGEALTSGGHGLASLPQAPASGCHAPLVDEPTVLAPHDAKHRKLQISEECTQFEADHTVRSNSEEPLVSVSRRNAETPELLVAEWVVAAAIVFGHTLAGTDNSVARIAHAPTRITWAARRVRLDVETSQ